MIRKQRNPFVKVLLAFSFIVFAIGLALNLPFLQEHLGWRISDLRARIKYALSPPEEAVFTPNPTIAAAVQGTVGAFTPTASVTPVPTRGATATPAPSATPTITPTPLPSSVSLEGVRYEDQHGRWNYCGPANFSMALNFWGWQGNRDVLGAELKPMDVDKNVMPYEFRDYIQEEVPGIGALLRFGGDIDLLKKLVAAGYPVVAEKGYFTTDAQGKYSWLGHYQFVTGYDDAEGTLIVQDTYIKDGENHHFPYEDFTAGWRAFNYLFVVVYPQDQEAQVLDLLGPWADTDWATSHALEVSQTETQELSGNDLFFAWFNVGTSHVNLRQYVDAAYAYDYAFTLYADLPAEPPRPYRMLWYQSWPYWAYYYSARYQDVINLANTTLQDTISEPVLEESLYWRAMARYAIGEIGNAVEDFRASLKVHPDFPPTVYQMEQLGISE
jgi:tetratricopeptide (TPR) repeat protein